MNILQGEGHKNHAQKLYKKKKPQKEPRVRNLIARNATMSTKRNVYSDITNEMVAAIQPLGWLMPKREQWKQAWGKTNNNDDAVKNKKRRRKKNE